MLHYGCSRSSWSASLLPRLNPGLCCDSSYKTVKKKVPSFSIAELPVICSRRTLQMTFSPRGTPTACISRQYRIKHPRSKPKLFGIRLCDVSEYMKKMYCTQRYFNLGNYWNSSLTVSVHFVAPRKTLHSRKYGATWDFIKSKLRIGLLNTNVSWHNVRTWSKAKMMDKNGPIQIISSRNRRLGLSRQAITRNPQGDSLLRW